MEEREVDKLVAKRVALVLIGDEWAGAYWSPYWGAWALITEKHLTVDETLKATRAWVRESVEDSQRRAAGMLTWSYFWRADPDHPGFMAPYRQDHFGDVFLDRPARAN